MGQACSSSGTTFGRSHTQNNMNVTHEDITRFWQTEKTPWRNLRGSALGYFLKSGVEEMIVRCNTGKWTVEEMRKQHGDNFAAVLPPIVLPASRPLRLQDYYEIGYQRILAATPKRGNKELQLFRLVHDDFQMFLNFRSYIHFRYPTYDFAEHPTFGSAFSHFFHRALMSLVNWEPTPATPPKPLRWKQESPKQVASPVQWRFVSPRDASPVRT